MKPSDYWRRLPNRSAIRPFAATILCRGPTVKIATWNVNSIRIRLPRLTAWLARRQPDVVRLQETKPDDLPRVDWSRSVRSTGQFLAEMLDRDACASSNCLEFQKCNSGEIP